MRPLRSFFLLIYNIYAVFLLVIAILLLFPVVLLSVVLKGDKRGNFLYNRARQVTRMVFVCCGIRHQPIHETPHNPEEPVIFVFNHISYLDALVILRAVDRQPFRGLGKEEIGSIPVAGYIYKSTVITVKRADSADRARSVADMKKAISNNISIALAPEGTFNTTGNPLIPFFDGAFRIAIETQTPIKPLLFLDTFDRLHYSSALSLTPGRSRVVFLEKIEVSGMEMKDLPELKQKVYDLMEKALIRYKASWIRQ